MKCPKCGSDNLEWLDTFDQDLDLSACTVWAKELVECQDCNCQFLTETSGMITSIVTKVVRWE